MAAYYDALEEAAAAIRARCADVPRAAIVLGSGLGAAASALSQPVSIPYASLPHWPPATVTGHEGRLVVGSLGGRTVAMLSGRAHLYEGHQASTVVFGVRVLALLGVKTLVLTNAAGGINPGLQPGAFMIVDDHINLTGANPLVGLAGEVPGPQFPDMSEVYSPRLRHIADEAAAAAAVHVHHGVYAAVLGPSYETPAEIRYLRMIGADAVGMSTVPEAIAARHMGVEVLAVSCITNMAAGAHPKPLAHDEVMAVAHRAGPSFRIVMEGIVERL